MKPSYSEQFNKLTSAYIAGKVDPYTSCGCFVGNLLNNSTDWIVGRKEIGNINLSKSKYSVNGIKSAKKCIQKESHGLYTLQEIYDIEKVFLDSYDNNGGKATAFKSFDTPTDEDEEALFIAFEETLEYLKELHISKGEVIDEVPVFKKRMFVTA
jgi:hypothetical protein